VEGDDVVGDHVGDVDGEVVGLSVAHGSNVANGVNRDRIGLFGACRSSKINVVSRFLFS
jgi:hypothetical protein